MLAKTPKPKKCPECGEKFIRTRAIQPVCDRFECKLSYATKTADKLSKKRAKEDRAETRKAKENLKTRRDYMREAQVAFNAFIRERDRQAGYPCISSGRPLDWSGNAVDAGHYRSVGSAPHLRFDERNVHAQSKHDNQWKSGNACDYRIGLIRRIGLEAVEALEADQTERHYTIDDLKDIRDRYREKLRELKAAEKNFC